MLLAWIRRVWGRPGGSTSLSSFMLVWMFVAPVDNILKHPKLAIKCQIFNFDLLGSICFWQHLAFLSENFILLSKFFIQLFQHLKILQLRLKPAVVSEELFIGCGQLCHLVLKFGLLLCILLWLFWFQQQINFVLHSLGIWWCFNQSRSGKFFCVAWNFRSEGAFHFDFWQLLVFFLLSFASSLNDVSTVDGFFSILRHAWTTSNSWRSLRDKATFKIKLLNKQ